MSGHEPGPHSEFLRLGSHRRLFKAHRYYLGQRRWRRTHQTEESARRPASMSARTGRRPRQSARARESTRNPRRRHSSARDCFLPGPLRFNRWRSVPVVSWVPGPSGDLLADQVFSLPYRDVLTLSNIRQPRSLSRNLFPEWAVLFVCPVSGRVLAHFSVPAQGETMAQIGGQNENGRCQGPRDG